MYCILIVRICRIYQMRFTCDESIHNRYVHICICINSTIYVCMRTSIYPSSTRQRSLLYLVIMRDNERRQEPSMILQSARENLPYDMCDSAHRIWNILLVVGDVYESDACATFVSFVLFLAICSVTYMVKRKRCYKGIDEKFILGHGRDTQTFSRYLFHASTFVDHFDRLINCL